MRTLKHLLLLIACCLLTSGNLRAQNATDVQREALFTRAFQSLGFVLMAAGSEGPFVNSLNPDEVRAFSLIANMAVWGNTRAWLKKQSVHDFIGTDEAGYVWVVSGSEQGVMFQTKVSSQLEFSNNQSLFELPGQPPRTAVTSSDAKDPIYINRNKISRSGTKISFAEAVSLAVHEYGNKIGDVRNQSAIDSVAAKIQKFVEQKTLRFQTQSGTTEVVSFPKAAFEDLAQFSFTPPAGGGNPRLRFYGDEGLYVFFEDEKSVRDLSPSLEAKVRTGSLRVPPTIPEFQWVDYRWTLGSFPKVTESKTGELRIEMSVEAHSIYVPFAKKNSPDPRSTHPWTKADQTSILKQSDMSRVEWSVDISKPEPVVNRLSRKSSTEEDAVFQITKVSSGWQGGDFVLIYKMASSYVFPDPNFPAQKIQPFLLANLDLEKIEIIGTSRDGFSDQFEFRFKNLKRDGVLHINGMELGATLDQALIPSNQSRIKVLLPAKESVDLAQANRTRPSAPLKLLSSQIRSDGTLRLLFQSDTPLSSLGVYQSLLQKLQFAQAGMRPQETKIAIEDRLVLVPANGLKQTVRNGKLLVEWDFDRDLALTDVMAYQGVESRITVLPERIITALRATNESLQTQEIQLANPHRVRVDRFVAKAQRTCEAAF